MTDSQPPPFPDPWDADDDQEPTTDRPAPPSAGRRDDQDRPGEPDPVAPRPQQAPEAEFRDNDPRATPWWQR